MSRMRRGRPIGRSCSQPEMTSGGGTAINVVWVSHAFRRERSRLGSLVPPQVPEAHHLTSLFIPQAETE